MHPITKKIKIAAIKKGFTNNAELGDCLCIELNYLSQSVHGHTGFPLVFLHNVSEKLDLNLNELIKLKNENTK